MSTLVHKARQLSYFTRKVSHCGLDDRSTCQGLFSISMRPDAFDLQGYYDSRQGQLVRRLIAREIRTLWPDLAGQYVLGLGYATPFMGMLATSAARVAVIMPPAQGGVRWPKERPNLVALGTTGDLPIADRSVDRALVVHELETTEQVARLLREVWRVLVDGGEMIIVVPNRRGVWCLSEQTPFGQGRPYSSGQLKHLLRRHFFAPQKTGFALFAPPFRSNLLLRTAVAWERVGRRWAQRFAGVVIMLAEKQIYAAPTSLVTTRARRPAYTPMPVQSAIAAERRDSPPALTGGIDWETNG